MNFIEEQWFSSLKNALLAEYDSLFDHFNFYIADKVFCVKYLKNSPFAKMAKAFYLIDHSDLEACFTIYCVDKSLREKLPSLPWKKSQKDRLGQIAEMMDQAILLDEVRGILRAFSFHHHLGLFYIDDLANLPSWEFYTPLKEFIHLWCLCNNRLLIHAATISDSQSQCLLIGPSGAGKSTTTIYALEKGAMTCGDDYQVIHLSGCDIQAFPLYRTIKWLENSALKKTAHLKRYRYEVEAASSKHVHFMDDFCIKDSLILSEICFINRQLLVGEKIPLANIDAFRIVTQSTVGQLPYWVDKVVRSIKVLVENLPCYQWCPDLCKDK